MCEQFSGDDNGTWSLKGVSAGNILTQTSKGGSMDSLMEHSEEIIFRVRKGQGRLQYLGYIRARAGFNI